MARYRLGIYVVVVAISGISTTFIPVSYAGDGPNRVTSSDLAAGQWVDSLLGAEIAQTPRYRPKNRTTQRRSQAKATRLTRRAKLVNNPDNSENVPPYALVDNQGDVLHLVEPVKDVDLEAHVGETVEVRRDTGGILRASQLAFASKKEMQLAQHREEIPVGEKDEESSILADTPPHEESMFEGGDPLLFDDGIDFGCCPQCGGGVAGCRGGCGCGARGVLYAHGEYLVWWLDGMSTPPLVIQYQDIDLADPLSPVVVGPIQTIFGGNEVLDEDRQGGRITLGLWLDDYAQWGIEGEYLGLGDIDARFRAGEKDGLVPVIGDFISRPFFNTGVINGVVTSIGPSQEDVDTNRLDGSVTVDIRSEFQSAGIRLRHNLCCREGCMTCCGDAVGCGSCVGCGSGLGYPGGPLNRLCNFFKNGVRRTDVLYGIRWTSLDESLQVTEDLQEFVAIPPATIVLGNEIDVFDRFVTENEFWGAEIGYETEWEYRRWSLNCLSKVAIGNMRQRVTILGATTIDDNAGTVETTAGGLLTQGYMHPGVDGIPGNADDFYVGNIGAYERDEFSMIPEIGLTLGYDLTNRLKLTAGYTLVYLSNVVRPGDQIDLDVNGNLLQRNGTPDPDTIVPGDHPRFVFHQTDLWAHGLNFGAEYTW